MFKGFDFPNFPQALQKNSDKFINLSSKKGGYSPILTLGSSKDWPKRALLLPGQYTGWGITNAIYGVGHNKRDVCALLEPYTIFINLLFEIKIWEPDLMLQTSNSKPEFSKLTLQGTRSPSYCDLSRRSTNSNSTTQTGGSAVR